jgi:hypothetical protein
MPKTLMQSVISELQTVNISQRSRKALRPIIIAKFAPSRKQSSSRVSLGMKSFSCRAFRKGGLNIGYKNSVEFANESDVLLVWRKRRCVSVLHDRIPKRFGAVLF